MTLHKPAIVSFLGLLLVAHAASAAALLDPSASYSVNKELKGPGTALKALASARAEFRSELESFDLSTGKALLILGNKTEQGFTIKTLPPHDAKTPQKDLPPDGLSHAQELRFDKLKSVSEVYISQLPKPFITKLDIGAALSQTPLVIRGDGKTAKKVEGLETARAKALASVTDPAGRNAVNGLLDESVLLRTSSSTTTGGCLEGFEKRKLGDKWEFSITEQGAKLDYECAFEGWTEVKGNKVAVLGMELRKTRQVRMQPNGVPGVTYTSGRGSIYLVADSQEALMKMETEVLAEPSEEEARRLKAKGVTGPLNRTRMSLFNWLFPI